MKPYTSSLLHREIVEDGTLKSKDLYSFKTRLNRKYFIEIDRYVDNVYIAKFYLRIHKDKKNKYQIIVNDGDGFRILSTCIKLAHEISSEDSLASFGFIGENREGEEKNNTQRYRVYKLLSTKYFNPLKYDHIKDEVNSIYFLLNKKNISLTIQKVSLTLNSYYILP